jgi:hypothetical protein
MPTWREVSQGLYGAWRLAHLDRSAMAWFDRSEAALWHSFWAAALVYPGALILLGLRLPPEQWAASGPFRILAVETIGHVMAWTAFPLVMVSFCRWLGRDAQFAGFIIAFNWAQVLQMALALGVEGLVDSGLLLSGIAALLLVAAFIAAVTYEWFIARVALDAGGVAATVVVLIDFVLTALLSRIAHALY